MLPYKALRAIQVLWTLNLTTRQPPIGRMLFSLLYVVNRSLIVCPGWFCGCGYQNENSSVFHPPCFACGHCCLLTTNIRWRTVGWWRRVGLGCLRGHRGIGPTESWIRKHRPCTWVCKDRGSDCLLLLLGNYYRCKRHKI